MMKREAHAFIVVWMYIHMCVCMCICIFLLLSAMLVNTISLDRNHGYSSYLICGCFIPSRQVPLCWWRSQTENLLNIVSQGRMHGLFPLLKCSTDTLHTWYVNVSYWVNELSSFWWRSKVTWSHQGSKLGKPCKQDVLRLEASIHYAFHMRMCLIK